MKRSKKNVLAVLVIACALFALPGSVLAVPINGTFNAATRGSVTIPSGYTLTNTPSISFSGTWLTRDVPTQYAPPGGSLSDNDLYDLMIPGYRGTTGAIATTLDISGFSPIDDFLTWVDADGFSHSFDLQTLVRGSGSDDSIILSGIGIWNYDGPAFDPTIAVFQMTARNTGDTFISTSFSLATLPAVSAGNNEEISGVPAPSTLWLIGLALFSVTYTRRCS